LKITKIPVNKEENNYFLETFTGLLLEKKGVDKSNFSNDLDQKVGTAVSLNNSPYLLQKITNYNTISTTPISRITHLYVKLFIRVCKASFLLSRIITLFRFSIYANATEAIIAFRNTAPKAIQNDLCLPRALFAAVTSKKFKEKGVVFIGVSLPSKSMHAWIIEDGVQPDPYDTMWINFQPIVAIW
jgi:hypothetical protein